MKPRFLLLFVPVLLVLDSCKRPKCPEPAEEPAEEPVTVTVTRTANLKLTSANGKDANICDNVSLSGNNYSTTKYLVAQSWTNGGFNQDQYILIDFDLSSIPQGATITEALLNMFSDTTRQINGSAGKGHYQTGGVNDAYIRRITSPWVESTVSWDTRPSTDNTGQISIGSTTSNAEAYSINVTALIKNEHANESAYHGFMIGMVDVSPYRQVVFYSSDCEFPDLTPELKVTYTVTE